VPPADIVGAPPADAAFAPPADNDGEPPEDIVGCDDPPDAITAPPALIIGAPPAFGVTLAPPFPVPRSVTLPESPPPQAAESAKTRGATAKRRDERAGIGASQSIVEDYSRGSTFELSDALIALAPGGRTSAGTEDLQRLACLSASWSLTRPIERLTEPSASVTAHAPAPREEGQRD
jgi:hypothetical protein